MVPSWTCAGYGSTTRPSRHSLPVSPPSTKPGTVRVPRWVPHARLSSILLSASSWRWSPTGFGCGRRLPAHLAWCLRSQADVDPRSPQAAGVRLDPPASAGRSRSGCGVRGAVAGDRSGPARSGGSVHVPRRSPDPCLWQVSRRPCLREDARCRRSGALLEPIVKQRCARLAGTGALKPQLSQTLLEGLHQLRLRWRSGKTGSPLLCAHRCYVSGQRAPTAIDLPRPVRFGAFRGAGSGSRRFAAPSGGPWSEAHLNRRRQAADRRRGSCDRLESPMLRQRRRASWVSDELGDAVALVRVEPVGQSFLHGVELVGSARSHQRRGDIGGRDQPGDGEAGGA
jgi:hypothetical protein